MDPFGKVVTADRSPKGLEPREILSPALVRNGRSSFHIVVSVPAGEEFSLFVVQNPFGALGLNLYKEKYEKRGEAWIPDVLKPVSLQYTGHLPDPAAHVDGQTHMAFLLDILVPPRALVRRYRVEAQLMVQGRYVIYPMEVRVVEAAPKGGGPEIGRLPGVDDGADAAAVSVLEGDICGEAPKMAEQDGAPAPPTLRDILLRNSRQDIAIARAVSKERGRDVLPVLFGLEEGTEAWCRSPRMPARDRGAEWYLRVRDHLYRIAGGNPVTAPVEAAPELKVPVVE